MSDHTPTPWKCAPAGFKMRTEYSQSYCIAAGDHSTLIGGLFLDVRGGDSAVAANAKFLEMAVNSFDAHKTIIAELSMLLEAVIDHFGPLENNKALSAECRQNFSLARAALSKARTK
jgi:hypothetical protein